mmetsp:Transcript_12776/g.37109  ORF Transcript_12776/g.37109 Transcript_12776/m.37109 type:complete len:100 (+) Transcript_12776:2-301(+)
MYMPCKHLRLCLHCYEERRHTWQRDLDQVRTENTRRRAENEEAKRKNESRSREKQIPMAKLLEEPEYLCEHCKEKVVFAGSREEVLRWAAEAFTSTTER